MAHHGDEHVDKDDEDDHVIECEEEHADTLHDRRGMSTPEEIIGRIGVCR